SMAKELFVDKSYLLRTFKEVKRYTLLEYHNLTRCEKAKELLQRPELSIAYIASEVGYVSASHFTQVFRKVTGQTPSQYRSSYLRSLDE
ncbi:MAG: helix-turn-helix transcriptional regulator, partial [Firmicutes bacterium]|nr:helix-turn-helix transcriptional regulator [Bacillota bacterium]